MLPNDSISEGISGSSLTDSGGQGSSVASVSDTAPSPVSVISTNQGKAAIATYQDQHASDMEGLSSSDTDAANKNVTTDNQTKDAQTFAKSQGGLTPDEASSLGIDTSGYDWNSAAGMYVPKTGISTDPTKAPADIAAQKALAQVNQAFQVSTVSNDASTNNLVNSIKSMYTDAITAQTNYNKSANASQTTSGINKGGARYAGGVNDTILSATANAGMQKLVDLQTKEATAIAEAEAASSKNQLSLFAEKQKEVNDIRTQQMTTLKSLQDEAAKMKTSIQTKQTQANTDESIAKIVAQGVTDPATILSTLNTDSSGKETGSFTLKDISSALKDLAPDGDMTKLTGATKDFFILKGHNQLPTSVSSLPDDQQLFAYLSQQKAAASAGTSIGSGASITLSTAKSLGLPLSTVGMTQKDIAQSLEQSTPPHWFTEKLQTEKQQPVLPSVIQSTWDQYRQSFASSTPTSKPTTKIPPAIVGKVKALKASDAAPKDVSDFITFSGYDPSDPAFK